ncbi:MAG: CdaR family protein [Bryobacterales bacterium]|nr:CdaR family protein [Bryobacteraceae bacterium]MDW8353802.1 CdaR family protein [Bryobacterales bacterium]
MLRRLFENFGWKLLSVGVALLLWFALVRDPRLVTSISAPVQFRNIPPDLEMSSPPPAAVHLEVEGSAAQLRPDHLAVAAVVLDLQSVYQPGERTFTIDAASVALPAGVRLVRAVPAQIRLRFERRLSREVPVQVRFAGPPQRGYRVAHQEVRPGVVRVVGPESHVRRVEYAETDPVDLSAVVGEEEFHVQAFVPDPQVRFASPASVTVRVVVEKTPSEAGP